MFVTITINLTISGGSNWLQTSAPTGFWEAIASDRSGQILIAVQHHSAGGGSDGRVYTSTSGWWLFIDTIYSCTY